MDEGLLSLKWNNHHTTLVHLLRVLREQCFYTDAVLVCGSQFFGVHRLVLMACSDYFSDIFSQVQDCPKPVIVLQDMASSELEALLDYMYLGEVDVHQNKLPSLIKAAECLHIKGLAAIEDDPTKPLKTLLHPKGNKKNDNSSSLHTISSSVRKANSDKSSSSRSGQENDGENSRKRLWSSDSSRNYGNNNKFSRTDHNSGSKKSSVQRESTSDSAKRSSSLDDGSSSANRSELNDSSNISRLNDDENNDCEYVNDREMSNIKREDDGCSVKREDGMMDQSNSEGDLLPQAGVKIEDGSHHFQQYLQPSHTMDDQLFVADTHQSGSALNAAIASLPTVLGDSSMTAGLLPAGMRAAAGDTGAGGVTSQGSSSLASPAGGGCSSSSWSNAAVGHRVSSQYECQTSSSKDGDGGQPHQGGVSSSSLPLCSTVSGVLVTASSSGVVIGGHSTFESDGPLNYVTLTRDGADDGVGADDGGGGDGVGGEHQLQDDRYYNAPLHDSTFQLQPFFDSSQDRKSCGEAGSSGRYRQDGGGGGPSSKDDPSLLLQMTDEGGGPGRSSNAAANTDVLIIYSIHDLPKPHSVRNTSFSCGHCEKMFCHRGNFICHLGTHTGEKPYGCSLCQFRTSRKGNLESHVRSRHHNVVMDWSGGAHNISEHSQDQT